MNWAFQLKGRRPAKVVSLRGVLLPSGITILDALEKSKCFVTLILKIVNGIGMGRQVMMTGDLS